MILREKKMEEMWNKKICIFKLFLNILFFYSDDYSDLRVAYCMIIKRRSSQEYENLIRIAS